MDSTVGPAGAPRTFQVALAPCWQVAHVAGTALVPALGLTECRPSGQHGGAGLTGLVEGALPVPGRMRRWSSGSPTANRSEVLAALKGPEPTL